ncbi:hypothetical protein HNQ35_001894 [Cerasibacillus quisquiliarum]|uniref:Uncharacterized protein n=1 Tax=Cerasibacillus quisquiliarum TaxID=227865 RepID=A0A511UXN7_9BACI|nr:hypothetical protein [Cerasibacillus quisquiliarum]MBB5146685.1 hypothetical protein [Cerasibacillus quisquiliarum]GEN31384.1 hypothetical protein CQU01_16220 [Cerasibacillus quisquiliarum]
MTAAVWKLGSIGIIVFSLIMGFIFYYVMSPAHKKEKKKHLEETTSLLINFIIFIWLGKILVNINIFIEDPLAILAYPSDSNAFYIAVLLTALQIIYKTKRKQFDSMTWFVSFVPIFIFGSFVYEFIQKVVFNNSIGFHSIVFHAGILILYVIRQGKDEKNALSLLMMLLWSIGQLLLAFIMPYASLFGYLMAPWFLVILIVLFITLFIYEKRKVS